MENYNQGIEQAIIKYMYELITLMDIASQNNIDLDLKLSKGVSK